MKECLDTVLNIDCGILLDSTINYEHIFSKEFDRTVKSYEQITNDIGFITRIKSWRNLRKIILIAALIAAMSVTCFAVTKLIIKWHGTVSEDKQIVYIKGETMGPEEKREDFKAIKLKVPEDYKLVQEEFVEEIEFYCSEYETSDGEVITFIKQGNIDETGFVMNIEGASSDIIYVKEKEIHLWVINDTSTLKWDDGVYYYELSGNCDVRTLKEIAEAI